LGIVGFEWTLAAMKYFKRSLTELIRENLERGRHIYTLEVEGGQGVIKAAAFLIGSESTNNLIQLTLNESAV
jgi:hypothetical protein